MHRIVLFLLTLLLCGELAAQSSLYERYIDRYHSMAIDQMERYGVPASITLAQGLLESAAGTSRLATQGNNHFGIECGGRWNGPYMLMTDDAPDEKFRVYKNVSESYEDHSRFLRDNQRYASLFSLKRTDYHGWARGLKKAGYATSPTYANTLIEIIEKYNLSRYDHGHRTTRADRQEAERRKLQAKAGRHEVKRCNGQYYIVALPGDIVYLGKKRKRADRSLKRRYHVMESGESLYSVSQRYGIRLRSLCKMNPLSPGEHFRVGDEIKIK